MIYDFASVRLPKGSLFLKMDHSINISVPHVVGRRSKSGIFLNFDQNAIVPFFKVLVNKVGKMTNNLQKECA